METCNNPNSSPNDLNRVISLDPVLTGQVLKLINSAYYATAAQITSLTRAIIMLGLNTIKNMALSLSVMASVKGENTFKAFSIDEFWTHSICVGVISKLFSIIKKVSAMDREEYFIGGLLHDLGKIPMNACFPEEYVDAVKSKHNSDKITVAELAVFGFDHCGIGEIIAEKWKLNDAIKETLAHHHDSSNLESKHQKFVEIIELADAYANIIYTDTFEEQLIWDKISSDLLQRAGMDAETLFNMRNAVIEEIEKAKVFIQISKEKS